MASRRIVGVFAILFLVRIFSPHQLEITQVKNEDLRDHFTENDVVYAPLIIGAGQGTTGTHLFVDATCALGFVSLHYGIGCLPKYAVNISGVESANRDQETKTKVPLKLTSANHDYSKLLQRHSRISSGFLKAFKNNETDPLDFRDRLLTDLEEIIIWGKSHNVGLALHDTPYPMLMPEILKLVQKHYSSKEGKSIKPIIILSERDPHEYTERRLKSHGSYSWICRPPSIASITIEKMNPKTFEGGAFDFTGCISNTKTSGMKMDQKFYTMHQASKSKQGQFIVDSFEDYQDTMRDAAMFTYNMFDREDKTSVGELASMIAESFSTHLLNENQRFRMEEGMNFSGFKSLDTILSDGLESNDMVDILVFKNQVIL
eukprot:scaffold10249_cov59-Cyclotella_meneghiniana.AAC.20